MNYNDIAKFVSENFDLAINIAHYDCGDNNCSSCVFNNSDLQSSGCLSVELSLAIEEMMGV